MGNSVKHLHFISILFLSSFLISLFVTFFQRNEKTLYRSKLTSNGFEWKTKEELKTENIWFSFRHSKTFKNNPPQYKGEVKREYIIFGDYIFDGLGSLTHPDGRKYVGEWKDGKRNGQGTSTSTDGQKYVGEWKNGRTWNGIQYDKDGNILGKFVKGKVKEQ